jgi:hypothetical protein
MRIKFLIAMTGQRKLLDQLIETLSAVLTTPFAGRK